MPLGRLRFEYPGWVVSGCVAPVHPAVVSMYGNPPFILYAIALAGGFYWSYKKMQALT